MEHAEEDEIEFYLQEEEDTTEDTNAFEDFDIEEILNEKNDEDIEEEVINEIRNELNEAKNDDEVIDIFVKDQSKITNDEGLENIEIANIEEKNSDIVSDLKEAVDIISDEIQAKEKVGFFGKFVRTLSFFS